SLRIISFSAPPPHNGGERGWGCLGFLFPSNRKPLLFFFPHRFGGEDSFFWGGGASPPLRRTPDPPLHKIHYCTISEIVPAPTVCPPSRVAKRKPFSIATGVISSITSCTLSPRITISGPEGSSATPVTSVLLR